MCPFGDWFASTNDYRCSFIVVYSQSNYVFLIASSVILPSRKNCLPVTVKLVVMHRTWHSAVMRRTQSQACAHLLRPRTARRARELIKLIVSVSKHWCFQVSFCFLPNEFSNSCQWYEMHTLRITHESYHQRLCSSANSGSVNAFTSSKSIVSQNIYDEDHCVKHHYPSQEGCHLQVLSS